MGSNLLIEIDAILSQPICFVVHILERIEEVMSLEWEEPSATPLVTSVHKFDLEAIQAARLQTISSYKVTTHHTGPLPRRQPRLVLSCGTSVCCWCH